MLLIRWTGQLLSLRSAEMFLNWRPGVGSTTVRPPTYIVATGCSLPPKGARQGDPLGPAMFASAIQPVLDDLERSYQLLWQA